MGTTFDRWEKDPFFAAAEEVQDSADRLESVYRRWLQNRGDPLLRRDLLTVLGTAKWQLEELERAVVANDKAMLAGEGTVARHRQFMEAIGEKISVVERSLRESNIEEGEPAWSWVRLDEGERDDFACFLSGSSMDRKAKATATRVGECENGEASSSCSKDSCHSTESGASKGREEKLNDRCLVDSASNVNDVKELKISIINEETPDRVLEQQPNLPPPKISGFSGLRSAVESATKMRWYRKGFRKWKGGYQHDPMELLPVQNHQLSREIDACYERGKSCLSNCDDFDEKQLDGWAGALHRQLQRSQYQIQYGRPIQMIFWIVLAVLLIGPEVEEDDWYGY